MKGWTVGAVARRAGVATSALRFYEEQGLLQPERDSSGHRRYHPEALRRVAFIQAAQKVGLSLGEIREALDSLPEARTPNRRDWATLARSWRPLLDERIRLLQKLRDDLDGCIGCGCLSLTSCRLYNPDDVLGELGPGARILLGDEPPA